MNYEQESKLLGENINNLRYTDDTTLIAESEEELKSLLMRMKEGSVFRMENTCTPVADSCQWMNVSFTSAFSFSSFTLIKRLFSSSSLSAIRVVSAAYLRLLIFLLLILIPACDSSSPAFHMIYSAYKVSKQDENI